VLRRPRTRGEPDRKVVGVVEDAGGEDAVRRAGLGDVVRERSDQGLDVDDALALHAPSQAQHHAWLEVVGRDRPCAKGQKPGVRSRAGAEFDDAIIAMRDRGDGREHRLDLTLPKARRHRGEAKVEVVEGREAPGEDAAGCITPASENVTHHQDRTET
jgi:hypothetical protein